MKKVLLLSLFLLSACTNLQDEFFEDPCEHINGNLTATEAVSVSEADALRIAENFFNKNVTRNVSFTAESFTINDSLDTPLMYVINYSHGGFVVVSSRKTYYPIIAYSDKSNFPEGKMPDGLDEWIQDVKRDISNPNISDEARQSHIQYLWNLYDDKDNSTVPESRSTTEESKAFRDRITELRASHPGYLFYPLSQCNANLFSYGGNDIIANLKNLAAQYGSPERFTIVAVKDNTRRRRVGPLLSTEWHQNSPFNAQCPNQSKAGCVAIAMAQIMKFHEHPNTYNWSNMPDKTATNDTQQLIHDIGSAAGMDYGTDKSSSNIDKAKKAFINKFQYNAVIKDFDYNETANELLIHNRPVYMRGADEKFLFIEWDGHAWVCDGAYDVDNETLYFIEYLFGGPGYYSYSSPDDYPSAKVPGVCGYGTLSFHMNWGWMDGSYNGWYNFTDVNVGDYNFKHNRKNLYVTPK
ncbi:C10 family peptidase [Bacteroides sp.]|uniref:C10 family peptidase n=2 Tax=Bacteroides TaxID=816 RepID=UPI0023BD820F|nr:C10 family peptidase [Bacteroides sp.]MDE5711825.1 C10 family peptidase [Bacteroides sp.]MDE6215399.1 C10 family peptidase [Bacteroides sp.]